MLAITRASLTSRSFNQSKRKLVRIAMRRKIERVFRESEIFRVVAFLIWNFRGWNFASFKFAGMELFNFEAFKIELSKFKAFKIQCFWKWIFQIQMALMSCYKISILSSEIITKSITQTGILWVWIVRGVLHDGQWRGNVLSDVGALQGESNFNLASPVKE